MSAVQRLPTGRAGQALAVALALLVLLLAWEVVGEPLLDWYGDRDAAVAHAQAREAHMAMMARSLPLLRREQARVRASGPAASSLLVGGSDAIAAASLQSRIQDMATTAGTALSSTEALPARQEGAYRRIAVRVSFNATLPVLVQLLKSLDGSTPRMLVDDLQLHTSPILVAQAHDAAPPLDATLTVIGFRAGHAADSDATSDDGGSGGGSGGDAGSTP